MEGIWNEHTKKRFHLEFEMLFIYSLLSYSSWHSCIDLIMFFRYYPLCDFPLGHPVSEHHGVSIIGYILKHLYFFEIYFEE